MGFKDGQSDGVLSNPSDVCFVCTGRITIDDAFRDVTRKAKKGVHGEELLRIHSRCYDRVFKPVPVEEGHFTIPSAGRHGPSLLTYPSKTVFYPLDPRPEDFNILDISYAAAREGRYSNFTPYRFSIAQHMVLVSLICPRMEALMHDVPEVYGFRDVSGPLKHSEIYRHVREAENRLLGAVMVWAGCPLRYAATPNNFFVLPDAVHLADRQMAVTEAYEIYGGIPAHWPDAYRQIKPYKFEKWQIRAWSEQMAEDRFLQRFRELEEGLQK